MAHGKNAKQNGNRYRDLGSKKPGINRALRAAEHRAVRHAVRQQLALRIADRDDR